MVSRPDRDHSDACRETSLREKTHHDVCIDTCEKQLRRKTSEEEVRLRL